MRRFARILLLTMVATLVLSAPVFAYLYRAPLTIAESNGNSYTMLPVLVDSANEWMAGNGFMKATALDTRVQTLGGSNKPHLVTEDKTLTAVPVAGASQTNLYFVTGESDLTALDIMTGWGGYITTLDNANIETTNDFKYEFDGYVHHAYPEIVETDESKTETQGTNHIVNLTDEGEIFIVVIKTYDPEAADPDITIPAGWTSLYSGHGLGRAEEVAYRIVDGTEGETATFTSAVTAYSAAQTFGVNNISETLQISAFASTSSVNPNSLSVSPSLGVETYSLFISAFTSFGAVDYTITAYPANYIDGLLTTGAAGANFVKVGSSSRNAAVAAEDPAAYTVSDSTNWYAWTIAIQNKTYLIRKAASFTCYHLGDDTIEARLTDGGTIKTVTATGLTDGEQKVEIYTSAGNMVIEIDDVVEDTEALAGAVADDNGNNWIFMSDSLSYMDYYSHTTGGVARFRYEQSSMIEGTILPNDLNPGTYNGAITWGTNPVGVDVSLGSMESSGQAGTGETTVEPPRDVLPEVPGSDWFGDGTVTKASTLTNPFRAFITMISDNTTLDEIQVWRWMGIAILLFVTVAAAKALRGHQGITSIIAGVVLGGLVAFDPNIFPFWLLVISIGCFIGGIIAERSPSL